MTEDGNSVRALADQFRELVQREVKEYKDEVKAQVGDLSKKVDALSTALNAALLSLPETVMTRRDCVSYHASLDKLLDMEKRRVDKEFAQVWTTIEGKVNKADLGARTDTLAKAWDWTLRMATLAIAAYALFRASGN